MCANICTKASQPIQTVYKLRSQGMTWQQCAAQYNVSASDACTPCPAKCAAPCSAPGSPCMAYPAGSGPAVPCCCPAIIYDTHGNVMLTEDEVRRLYAKGYDWLDVAIAANIVRYYGAGLTVDYVLERIRAGATWTQLAADWGLNPCRIFNVCNYPFEKKTAYPNDIETANLNAIQQYQKPGPILTQPPVRPTWTCAPTPCGATCPSPCPPAAGPAPCPTPCPTPCPAPAAAPCPAPCPTPAAAPCPAPCAPAAAPSSSD